MPAAVGQLADITQGSPQLVFYCPRICDGELHRSIIFIGEGFTTSVVIESYLHALENAKYLRSFFGISPFNCNSLA